MSEVIRAILNLVLTICLCAIVLLDADPTPLQSAIGAFGSICAGLWLLMTGYRLWRGKPFTEAVSGRA